MSNFAENRENQAEKKKRQWERKQINAKLYHDLAKLAFAALVLGQLTNIQNNDVDWFALILGAIVSTAFVKIGNNFLNNK